jgi:predicted DNA-binding transcriptional regulator AlpA
MPAVALDRPFPQADIDASLPDKRYFTRRELAHVLDVRVEYFEELASKGKGPPFERIGRMVRYPRTGVIAWLRETRFTPKEA